MVHTLRFHMLNPLDHSVCPDLCYYPTFLILVNNVIIHNIQCNIFPVLVFVYVGLLAPWLQHMHHLSDIRFIENAWSSSLMKKWIFKNPYKALWHHGPKILNNQIMMRLHLSCHRHWLKPNELQPDSGLSEEQALLFELMKAGGPFVTSHVVFHHVNTLPPHTVRL